MKQPHNLTYASKILLMMFSIILLMALILSFSSWRLSSAFFSRMEKELLEQNVASAYKQVTTSVSSANNMVTQVIGSSSIKTLMSSPTPHSEAEAAQQLHSAIQSVLRTSATSPTATLEFINIYLKNGWQGGSLPLNALPYDTFSQWSNLVLSAVGTAEYGAYVPTCWVDSVYIPGNGIYGHCLVGVRFLYNSVTLEKVGVVVVGVKQSSLSEIYASYGTTFLLVRRDGKIISSGDLQQLGQDFTQSSTIIDTFTASDRSHLVKLEDGSEYFIYRMSGGASWFLCPVDVNTLNHGWASTTYRKITAVVTVMALTFALLLSWLSSKGLTKSLRQLKSVVQKVYDGDMSARFQTREHDEIAYLGLKVNDMLDQVDASFRIQERDAMEKKDLELQLMQSQINPHLLYNTLNSALGIIRQGDMQKVEDLILSLGSFFRLALSKGNEEVPLSNEIAMIQNYLELQNLGRGKSFTLRDEVPEQWRNCRILRLTLQPLVENSVIHGFCDWREDGEIVLTVKPDEAQGQLQIILCDNGLGILPEELEVLLRDLHTYPPAKEHEHYGLYNVERRIKNKYGNQYGMHIESEVGEFTRSILTLPIIKETSHDRSNAD